MTTREAIRKRSALFKGLCVPGYFVYVLVCVYMINGARGFLSGFWQMFVILSIMNLIDRFLIDDYWVGHTDAWIIPGTEDLRPYITRKDTQQKWIMGTVGVLVNAYDDGVLSAKEVEAAFDALRNANRRISEELIQNAMAHIQSKE